MSKKIIIFTTIALSTYLFIVIIASRYIRNDNINRQNFVINEGYNLAKKVPANANPYIGTSSELAKKWLEGWVIGQE